MHALYIIVPVLAILALAYRYYSAFIATQVMSLDDTRTTPAHARYDGANYQPTSRWVLFGRIPFEWVSLLMIIAMLVYFLVTQHAAPTHVSPGP